VCKIDLDDSNQWPSKYPPIILDELGNFILPESDSENREIQLDDNQIFLLGCSGTTFDGDSQKSEKTGKCVSGEYELESEQIESLGGQECSRQPVYTTEVIGTCGQDNSAKLIRIEFDVNTELRDEGVTITVCHLQEMSSSLWAQHTIWDEIEARDTGNNRPSFDPEYFDFDVDYYYKMTTQRETVADLVGSQDLAEKYIGDQSSQLFLSRGHLAPNADFIFYSWQDSTFFFINVAPQWQSFNGRNWNTFEQRCRDFAIERSLDLIVYTGTSGVIELEDINGDMVPIYLYDGDKLPVPRYYWKILYDPASETGVAIIGINNPHLETVPDEMIVCPALESHPLLTMSQPENIVNGYMWACNVKDLANALPEVPDLPDMGLLS